MKIFITGHKGYIGSALTEVVTRNCRCHVRGYDLVDGDDILNYPRLSAAMVEFRPHIVIHLAALSSVTACNTDIKRALRENGVGTRNVLKAMKEAGCDNIIYASTSSVYGDQPHVPYTENTTASPCSPYGITKYWGELAVFNHYLWNQGNYVIMRMFNVVGTSGYYHLDNTVSPGYDRLFGALQTGRVTIYGHRYRTSDGTCERDYISLKDVCVYYCRAIHKCMTKSIRMTVNICTGIPTSVMSIIVRWNNVAEQTQTKDVMEYQLPTVSYIVGLPRPGDPERVFGDNSRACRVLSFTPEKKIDDIINDLVVDKRK